MKKSVLKTTAIALSGLLIAGQASAGSLQSHIAAYAPEDCKPVVDQVVSEKRIDKKNISKIQYLTDYVSEGENGEILNYQAWFSFKNCRGNYVVNMNKVCQIESTWGTDGCKLDRISMNDTSKD